MVGTVFRAACRLQEAVNFFITAKTAEELGHPVAAKTYREIAERDLRVAVEKLGYELTPKPLVDAAKAAKAVLEQVHENCGGDDDNIAHEPLLALAAALGEPVRLTITADAVQEGDRLDGQFIVGDISHGPLENQLRFRDHNETAVAFRHATDLVVVERRAQA